MWQYIKTISITTILITRLLAVTKSAPAAPSTPFQSSRHDTSSKVLHKTIILALILTACKLQHSPPSLLHDYQTNITIAMTIITVSFITAFFPPLATQACRLSSRCGLSASLAILSGLPPRHRFRERLPECPSRDLSPSFCSPDPDLPHLRGFVRPAAARPVLKTIARIMV